MTDFNSSMDQSIYVNFICSELKVRHLVEQKYAWDHRIQLQSWLYKLLTAKSISININSSLEIRAQQPHNVDEYTR